jgi:hypothetical protein
MLFQFKVAVSIQWHEKTLSPKQVARIRGDFERTYILHGQLSSDAAHRSVTALNRCVVPHTATGIGGIDVDPAIMDLKEPIRENDGGKKVRSPRRARRNH